MRLIIVAAGTALLVALFATPWFIKFLVKKHYGQFIRDDGPTSHHTKRGTPTMGGVVIIVATVFGYLIAHIVTMHPVSSSGLAVLFLVVGMGTVGFLDDYIKISKARSLGLRAWQKLVGQTLVASVFGAVVIMFPNANGITPGSTAISFVRDTEFDFRELGVGAAIGIVLYLIWVNLMVAGTTNAVNLTDGLDGLATGATAAVAASYLLIGLWQFNQNCWMPAPSPKCYPTPDPLDLAIVAAALLGACVGFLWWNASPARIFMGDTGSLALGGAVVGLAITSRTQLLSVILCGLFVIITMSVIIQVASFKLRKKRVFRMAPLQHHFELLGWAEVTIVIRFWIIACLFCGLGVAAFYAEWMTGGTV
ncbi:Phospho-N-acetylmuramoyl-pentapeptide-transferase [Dermatophilus congolensis]|uniref:Phospho-N-acetylmuramoyl-pentapeptide-transferase n=1 Tax=Dermatophilus congolensis TaxID=1863 RepID=A0AA46BM17_9MICO|nr:phospho-N-acetylmuramoyl-pentapeptide-transferase [Dermatophilus congolensis]STD06033.1 Phospho-N-acetylmuramoyl-pentapeptide-transferase [Dermatophilus congolensis]